MYKSPIDVLLTQRRAEFENNIYTIIQNYGINVDKDELIKALQYDREQYDKGYADGRNEARSEVAREIFVEIEKILPSNLTVNGTFYRIYLKDAIAELKKKYIGGAEDGRN